MKRFFTPAIFLCILLLNLWFLHSPLLGSIFFVLYVILLCKHVSSITKNSLAGPIVTLSSFIILNTILYYAYGTTPVTTSVVMLLSLLFFIPKKEQGHTERFKDVLTKWSAWKQHTFHPFLYTKDILCALVVTFFDTSLLGFLWLHRTIDLMPSPWQAVDAGFFLIFTVATILLTYIVLTSRSRHISTALVSLHLFVMYAIAALLYPLGYGFDAFIHRATESWIFQYGFITPKQPYYIGQYSFVVFLSHITGLSIHLIDVYLVPLLAALLIPFTVAFSYAKKFNMRQNHALIHILAIALVPFLSFHLTTPHNLVVLLSLLTVFTTLLYQKNKENWHIPLLLTLTALLTHPLIGAPLFGFFLTTLFLKHTKKTSIKHLWLGLSTFGQIFLLPIMFTVNNLRTGHGWPMFGNPFLELPKFFELFVRPYWYLKHAPIFWEMIYTWERMIVPVCVLISLLGFFLYKKKPAADYLYPLTAMGMFLSAWLLRSWITFPDVVVYEQGDYPMRLIHASMLFLLPWFLYGLYRIAKALYIEHDKYWRTILVILGAGLLTVSFYFSYPQRNIKSRFPGFNVTQADFDAVEWIHKHETGFSFSPTILPDPTQIGVVGTIQSGEETITKDEHDYNYIVLSNQLVSATALTKFSFAKTFDTPLGELFYYAIPTGGPLYQQYGKMLYQGQKRAYMETAMDLVGVDTSYFVVNSYWANADKIIEGAKQTADSWEVIHNGDVWVFVYER